MFGAIGILVTIGAVFGGYALAGGKIGVILHALPFEMMIIGGAALGSFILSNDTATLKHSVKGMMRAFKGARWKPADHSDMLCLLYQLLRLARSSPVELEEHIERPQESAIFRTYPRILADHEAVTLITDTLRSASLNYDDPYQVEDMLGRRIALLKEEGMHVPHALPLGAAALQTRTPRAAGKARWRPCCLSSGLIGPASLCLTRPDPAAITPTKTNAGEVNVYRYETCRRARALGFCFCGPGGNRQMGIARRYLFA